MAIERVDQEKCVGCGLCCETCYADVFRMDAGSNTSVVKYAQDCALCRWCEYLCPAKAIVFTSGKPQPVFTSWG